MLTRNFSMNNITSTTNDVLSSSNDLYNNTKEALTKRYGLSDAMDDAPESAEIQKRISSFCNKNRYDKYGGDWLGSLNRNINKDSSLNLCSDGKKMMGEGDTLLTMASKLRTGGKFDPSSLVNNFTNNELKELGITSVPSCLTDSLFGALKGIFTLPGGLIPKLDLSKLLNNKCLKESINSGISSIDTLMKGTMVQTMLGQGNSHMANDYVNNQYALNPLKTTNMLETNISGNYSSNTIEQLGLIGNRASGNIDKSNVLSNVNNEVNSSKSSVFGNLDNYFGESDASYFKGKSNLDSAATSYLSNKKSSDTFTSSTKTTNLDSASLSKISNLFI